MATVMKSRSGLDVRILPDCPKAHREILSDDALEFVAMLHQRFAPEVERRLAARAKRLAEIRAGKLPDFLPETRSVRESDWTVAPLPKDLLDRRVEITGPVTRKMIINALNCGADMFMADFEDANAPHWANVIEGQINLRDAVRRRIDFTEPGTGKAYKLAAKTAVLLVRPRGWHLPEKHILIGGKPASAPLVDFGLFFFHNARELIARGTGPYFYLPKMESHLEARLWNDVFCAAQDALGVERGTVKATVLIEHILAAFEMDEILYELREHSAGLNCGRWDYIFSIIKTLGNDPARIMPDRGLVTMTTRPLRSYSLLLIRTCHRRDVHAMGGMAAQIPIRDDADANRAALEKVRADKEREAKDGHDGTWVAHPGLVAIAKEQFDLHMTAPNQIANKRQDVAVTREDLLAVPEGAITEAGMRQNLNVGLLYIEAWLGGNGCVPLYNLMEDAATAEISRTQLWQWVRHKAKRADGIIIDRALVERMLDEEVAKIRAGRKGDTKLLDEAARLLRDGVLPAECPQFLTLPAYDSVIAAGG
jgi:malate synthase